MPFELYLAKNRSNSRHLEDPEQVHQYQRELLTDFRPDAPFLEADMTRRNNMSESILNVRYHGSRSEYQPYLPDGTFLDWEFLEPDPRGCAQEYNWKRFIENAAARAQNVPFTSDDDFTTHESRVTGFGVSDQHKRIMEEYRQRYKNFSTSKEGWTSGILPSRLNRSQMCLVASEENPAIEEGVCYNKSTIVTDLSNSTPVGYQTTSDHEFNIASYSQVRNTRSLAEDDWGKNRRNTYHDQDLYVHYGDNAVPKSLALQMVDMSQKKFNETQSLRNYKFANSQLTTPAHTRTVFGDPADVAWATDAGLQAGPGQDIMARNIRQAVPRFDTNLKKKTKLSQELAKSIVSMTRANKIGVGDVRDKVRTSVLFSESAGTGNRGSSNKLVRRMSWDGVEDRKINDYGDKLVANFKRIKPKMYSRTDEIDNITFDDYKATSRTAEVLRLGQLNEMDRHASAEIETAFGSAATTANPAVAVGTKYVHNMIDREHREDIFDI